LGLVERRRRYYVAMKVAGPVMVVGALFLSRSLLCTREGPRRWRARQAGKHGVTRNIACTIKDVH
jgi:hypothetical protein